ncbi:hypothetical protein [Chondrinema litorale]|uniref:hypothetical protein n=1 Tax=Chondrinema litorale TaxID=2994555 RepID=UPI002542EE6F|nr:hypothetical protein [Chondrinema litorale]UZR94608.1 hypothetical protein OQ292_02085 [Chondrinema litorale]
MKTLITILLLIPSIVLAESTVTSSGASLSSMALILTLMVLFAFTRLFKNPEKKVAVKEVVEDKKELTPEELILEKISKLPILTENGNTNIKLLSSNNKEDTYIIVAKVDKTPEPQPEKKPLISRGFVLVVITLLVLIYVLTK